MPQEDNIVTLDDVKLLFRNFAGRAEKYNLEGIRKFNILLTPEQADYLSSIGFNVKTTREREGDDGEVLGGEPILEVKVNYNGRTPPRVVLITSRGRTELGEEEVAILDFADITHCDVMIRAYDWDVNGKTGRKAYLKSIYVTIYEDELALRYADVPIAGKRTTHEE